MPVAILLGRPVMATLMRMVVDPPGTEVEQRTLLASRLDEDGNEREPELITTYYIGEKGYYTGERDGDTIVLRDFVTGRIDATIRFEPVTSRPNHNAI